MAQPTVIAGTKLLLLVGNGASPEVFAEPCGLTSKGFDMAVSTNNTLIPDCDDPEAPAWEAKDVNSLSATVSGQGVMATESLDTWRDWFMSAESKNLHIKLDGSNLGYFSGAFILSAFKLGGQRGQKVTMDLTLVNTGAVTWTDVA